MIDSLSRAVTDLENDLSEIEIALVVEGQPRALVPSALEDACWVGREALRNAVTHSGATRIEIEIHYSPRAIRLRVRDNGRGIRSEHLDACGASERGIQEMHQRAQRLDTRLQIWSRADAGTEIELLVPARKVYESCVPQRGRRLFETLLCVGMS